MADGIGPDGRLTIDVRPKAPEDTTLQSLPTDAGTGGLNAAPSGSPADQGEAPGRPTPKEPEAPAAGVGGGSPSGELYPGAVARDNVAPEGMPDPYPGAELMHSEAAGIVSTFGQQASASAVEGSAVLGGAAMGGAIGALGGPAAPVTIPAGVIIGGAAGYLAGQGYRNLLSVPRVEDLPDNLKPWGYGGEFFGGAIPMAAAPLTAARTGFRFAASRVGNYLNKIIDYAGESPTRFASAELSGVIGGTAGTVGAGEVLPGDGKARLAGGVIGGFFNPVRVVQTTLMNPAVGLVNRALAHFSEAGRKTAAANIISEAIALSHEDPSVLAQILRESGHPAVTSAQKSGSKALADIEAQLRLKNPQFRADSEKMAKDAYEAIRHTIDLLTATGDPAALATVAELRRAYFRALIANVVKEAEAKALASAAAITKDTPATRAELSKKVASAVEAALKQARTAEHYLWQQIPENTPASPDTILATIAELKKGMLIRFGQQLPPLVQRFEQTMSVALKRGDPQLTTSGELLAFRTHMLDMARTAQAKNDFNDARIFGKLAEAALEDLNAISGDVKEKVDAARTFSRELHDTFTRTFAGDTAAVNAKGAERIPAELVMQRALGAGAEGGDLRLSQLAEATDFMANKAWAEGAPEELFGAIGTIRESVDRVVRLAAADSINPISGRINVSSLARFISGHDAILNRFPEIRKVLERAIDDATALDHLESVAKNASPIIERRTAFSKLLGTDSPAQAIGKVINGPTPASDLLAMAKLAQRGGAPAVDGMAAAAWDHAFSAASAADGSVNFPALKNAFFGPMAPGVPSLMDTLVKGGVATRAEANAVAKMLEVAGRIAEGTAGRAEGRHGEFDPLMTAVVRIAGSRLGGAISEKLLGTSTLIANSAGARYLQGVFANVGIKGVQEILMQAARDPKLMAALIDSTPSQAASFTRARQIHAYLLAAGVLSLESQQHLDQPNQ
jgi:hypothetical protein